MAARIFALRLPGAQLFEPTAEELSGLVGDGEAHLWVVLDGHGEESQRLLADTFLIHPLLVEDALTIAAMPKLERHDDVLYVNVHGLVDGPLEGEVRTADVDFFLGSNFLITHHRDKCEVIANAMARLLADPKLLADGPAFLAHDLIDRLIDRFLPLMEHFDREVEQLEDRAMRDPDPNLLQQIFELKHSLQRLHRMGMHQKDLLARLHGDDMPQIPEPLRPFFRDVYDHFVRVTDLTVGYRELVASSLDAHLSMQSHRLNEIMKVLTLISTIMLPLTFVTSLYGMNFDDMPGIHWRYGFGATWALMLVTALAFYILFRRKGWL